MTNFWTARENMPYDLGFSLYHWPHLAWLAAIALAISLAVRWTLRLSRPVSRRLIQGLAWGCLGLELLRDIILWATGQFWAAYLPLDLCGLSIFLELAAAYWPNPWLRECVYSLSLPGACLALLFPNWTKLPIGNYFCIHGFVLHAILVLIPILLWATGRIQPNPRRLPFCFACITLACIPIWLVNQRLGTNFFFLATPSKGSPLVWFAQLFGSHLVGFPILLLLIWTGLYAIAYGIQKASTRKPYQLLSIRHRLRLLAKRSISRVIKGIWP